MPRTLTTSNKKYIAGKQHYKCANNPSAALKGLENYLCPLWQKVDKNIVGDFDEAGYEIDHIEEYSLTANDNENNLQALCLLCHRVKTIRFAMNNKNIAYGSNYFAHDKYKCQNEDDNNTKIYNEHDNICDESNDESSNTTKKPHITCELYNAEPFTSMNSYYRHKKHYCKKNIKTPQAKKSKQINVLNDNKTLVIQPNEQNNIVGPNEKQQMLDHIAAQQNALDRLQTTIEKQQDTINYLAKQQESINTLIAMLANKTNQYPHCNARK